MKQIALIEDDQKLLKRMSSFLNSQNELKCVIAASSLGVFFECLDEESKPDLLLLDIELSEDVNAITHIQKIKNLLPSIKILVIAGHNNSEHILRALRHGADSFYLKGPGLQKLLEAINSTLAGGAYLDPEAAVHMIPFLRGQILPPVGGSFMPASQGIAPPKGVAPSVLQLSLREQQVARGLMEGRSYKEIARKINLSVNTVRHYVKALYKKLGVNNKIQLSNKLKGYV